MKKERRSAPRVEPPTPLDAKVQASFPVRVVDISQRGVQLEMERSLRPNVSCDLRFPSSEGEFWVRGTVRRCKVWGFGVNARNQKILVYRAGVEFDQPPPDLLERLHLVIPELPGAPPVAVAPPAEAEEAKGKAGGAGKEAKDKAAGHARHGPVKIRISSAHVRKILSDLDEE